jgi:hypothetical protein
MAIKLVKTFRGLQDVAIVDNEGNIEVYAMVEDPVDDRFEEDSILERLQTAFNIKIEK